MLLVYIRLMTGQFSRIFQTSLTLLLLVPVGHHDICGLLYPQIQQLHWEFSVLVYPEDLVLQARSVDEVLK